MKNKLMVALVAYVMCMMFPVTVGAQTNSKQPIPAKTESTIKDNTNISKRSVGGVTGRWFVVNGENIYNGEFFNLKKDDPNSITFSKIISQNDGYSYNFSETVLFSDVITLDSLPEVIVPSTISYTTEYSVDKTTFSATPPSDIKQLKGIKVKFEMMNKGEQAEIKASAKVNWSNTTSGLNEIAQYYEDDRLNSGLLFDSYRMVTATYKDEDGNNLVDPKNIYGEVGQAYSTKAADISGYTLITTPSNATGEFTDEDQTVNYVYRKDQTAINVKDSTIYVGDNWNAKDNFINAVDKDGNPVPYSKVTVDDRQKDTSKPGQFKVTYTLDGVTSTATVTVKAIQTAVNVHDSTIYVGDKWNAKDNFDSAVDRDGNEVKFDQIKVDDSQKDTSKPGQFKVTYTYGGVTSTAIITVKAVQTAVNVHDSTIYVGDDWKAKDNFDSALDKDGNAVNYADIKVDDSKKDTSKPGQFKVTYTYDGVTSTATITVKKKQTGVNVHDSTIYVGDDWKAKDNFDSAVDKDGNPVSFRDVTVDDRQKDTSKAGTFTVTYTYDGVSATATITVKDRKTAVNVHDSTIYVGDAWKAKDNFDSALDRDGKKVEFNQITVDESQVDLTQPGKFTVIYTYDGVTATATITVKARLSSINVHDSTIYVGDEWSAQDNFDGATDKAGNTIDFSQLTSVDDRKVDPTKPGKYSVTYSYDGETATAIVTVKDRQTAVKVHDSTVYVGDKWSAQDNFDSAIDKDGNPIDFSKIHVDDRAKDTNKAGSFTVTYSYDGVEATATITVKDKQTAVNVHDSTIYVGDKWNAQDNFDGAIDKDGHAVDFEKVTVKGNVDPNTPGAYQVTYTYDGKSSTATITVKKNATEINTHDSTIIEGDDWKPEDNFDGGYDKDGNPIKIDDVMIEGSVDPNTPGSYMVTYTFNGATSTATITVKAKPDVLTSVDVQYVDENGKKISEDTLILGEIGKSYQTNPKNIDGYTLIKTPKNQNGKFTKEKITVTYVYKQNATAKSSDDKPKKHNHHRNSIFPQTGEQISWTLSILGVIILVIAGIWFWKIKKDR